jgi:uncharacterized phiE125 gp8 family phage protein
MTGDLVLITPPAAEPVTPSDMLVQLELLPIADPTLAAQRNMRLTDFIAGARAECETYTRRAFITQTWLYKLDGWPPSDWRYQWRGYPAIVVPKPPVQSVDFVKYVDTFGNVQALPFDTSYGLTVGTYGYQLARGGEIEPGRLLSSWARPWPPLRMVPANVLVQFKAGYGGPVAGVSIASGSKAPTGLMLNPDAAPVLPGETGLRVRIPSAGATGDLCTFVASVASDGTVTLKDAAARAAASATAWIGDPIPVEILRAIKLRAQWYWEQGALVDQPLPRVITALLGPYRNMVA